MRSSKSAEDSRLLGERDTQRPGAAAFGTQRSDLGKGHRGLEVRATEAQSITMAKKTAGLGAVPSRNGLRPMEAGSGRDSPSIGMSV